ncbi:unnamed protein product [Prorocentrum cordatum]|uniref:RNA helicase n=1 Tax=Prorocentrum cordatum TaxID=2364126 RepID=A0ABN9WLF8_9DINO|nr:unnamed protein product [Polarella glacialis]
MRPAAPAHPSQAGLRTLRLARARSGPWRAAAAPAAPAPGRRGLFQGAFGGCRHGDPRLLALAATSAALQRRARRAGTLQEDLADLRHLADRPAGRAGRGRWSPPSASGRRGQKPAAAWSGVPNTAPADQRAVDERLPKMRWRNERLPIHDVLPEVLRHVREDPAMLLHAPTGAGKTTVVPLAVLEAGAVAGKILVLQPRRITCMSVARRMAYLSGEPLGEFVGYRIRHDTVVSNRTRIEVVTDGVLVRLLHQNPTLEGYGAVFFDEFHERNIESDLSFSLCLAAHRANNCRFKLVIMSATFGNLAESLRNILGKVGTVRSEGTTFPVEVRHVDLVADLNNYEPEGPQKFAEQVAGVIQGALGEHTGDVLVFLPGEREIMYTWIALNNMGIGDGQVPRNLAGWAWKLIDRKAADLGRRIVVHTLYGTLDQGEQDEALSPPPQGWRKVILATPIAESSITVPGVRVVVDAGLKRIKVEDPVACTSTMETVPISITSADQRKGRAGRVSEGVCYRLWSERHHERLQQNDTPEIHRSDLSPCLLDLSVQGYVSDDQIAALPWVDPPKVEDLGIARELLARLRGVEKRPDGGWALTVRGRQLAQFPVHPRLAHAILQAAHVSESFARDACDLAALMEEKELLRGGRPRHGGDLEARLDALQSKKNRDVIWAVRERVLMASEQLQRIAGLGTVESGRRQSASERRSLCVLLAWAFPELLARAERGGGSGGQRRYRMRYSQLATLDGRDPLAKERDLRFSFFWPSRRSLAIGSSGPSGWTPSCCRSTASTRRTPGPTGCTAELPRAARACLWCSSATWRGRTAPAWPARRSSWAALPATLRSGPLRKWTPCCGTWRGQSQPRSA